MEINIAWTKDFIPEIGENKTSESPVKFKLKYLSVAEVADCLKFVPETKHADGSVTPERIEREPKKMFRYGVMGVENLTVVAPDGTKRKIETADDFLVLPDTIFFTELYGKVVVELNKMITGPDQKNS